LITYLQGDATRPQPSESLIIMHICNDRGGWGKGFVLALSKRWTQPEGQYRKWYKDKHNPMYGDFSLGNVGWSLVGPGLWVANMIAQVGYGKTGSLQHIVEEDPGPSPIRYDALRTCLTKVAERARSHGSTIHAPRIGCNLSGGSWSRVEPLIQETMRDLQVFIYDFTGGIFNH
jgi:O-acetyl-ADP-ribose deacetylase (regulator of RNase III)